MRVITIFHESIIVRILPELKKYAIICNFESNTILTSTYKSYFNTGIIEEETGKVYSSKFYWQSRRIK